MNRSGHKCCFFGISAKKESQLCQLGGWVFASHNCRKVGCWSLRFRRFTEHGEIATSSAKNSFNHSRLITGGHLKICSAKDLMLFHFFTFLFLKNITSSILHQYLLGMGWGTMEILHPMCNWDDGLFQPFVSSCVPRLWAASSKIMHARVAAPFPWRTSTDQSFSVRLLVKFDAKQIVWKFLRCVIPWHYLDTYRYYCQICYPMV